MSRIEIGPLRPLAPVANRSEAAQVRTPAPPGRVTATAVNLSLDPGAPPVDAERVAQIRKAIEQGTYPLVPAKVADAMIAAGELLKAGK